MERTLKVLNDLEAQGVLGRYAIGGATGALFYIEPVMTDDLDVFVLLPQAKSGLLTLSPIYEALKAKGYQESGPYIKIEGVPVQFLPASNRLIEEALSEAKEVSYGSVKTRVLGAEYLAAIALQTGRNKDRDRVIRFLDEHLLDMPLWQQLLEDHGLQQRWREWTNR